MNTQLKQRPVKKPKPRAETFDELAAVRYEFIWTIALDASVIAVAMLARAGLLWLGGRLGPGVQADMAVHWLAMLADWGIVCSATAFTAFDLGKRVLRQMLDFLQVLHTPPDRPDR